MIAAVASHVPAQVLRWTQSTDASYVMGGPVAAVADRDGDGFQDVASIVQVCQANGGCSYWALRLISGRDGRTLRQFRDFGYGNIGFMVAGIGDMNGDGVRDYAVTIGFRSGPIINMVQVRSGTDDHVFFSLSDPQRTGSFGFHVVGDIDIDGDGRPNLLITANADCHDPPFCTRRLGSVYAYAPDGWSMYRVTPPVAADCCWSVGLSLAKVGDVDGDGGEDFVTTGGEPGGRGVAYLISGRTGREIRRVFGALPGDGIGLGCAGCDDLDGDGIADFAVGSGGHRSRGVVRVFSSATGQPIYDYTSGRTHFATGFGSSIRADVDVDQDGIDDIVVADPEADLRNPAEGFVYVFSGRDGGVLARIRDFTGYKVATMPPQGDDPFPLLLTTVYPEPPRGSVSLYSAALPGVVRRGTACAGSLSTAPRIGIRDLDGRAVRIHLSDAPPGATVGVALGFQPALVPLDGLGLPGCKLLQSSDVIVSMQAGMSGRDAGYAHADVPLPLAFGAGTFALYGQWVVLGNGPVLAGGTTAALAWQH